MTKNLRNKSGKEYEDRVQRFFEKQQLDYKSQVFLGKTLFGKRMRPDFVVKYSDLTLVIECKNQVTRGTAEEKIFYTAHSMCNLHSQFPDVVPFLIMSGGGWSTECIKFMKEWEKTEPIIITTVNGLITHIEEGLTTWYEQRQPFKAKYSKS